ncbi:ATP-binding protein [Georgenia wutianyii]|uniref:ATP-binding protein n=2 Tax=Georgenia wutianyii TaxID=2585135 RepID=A0ABX5VME7_9MICO|nr:ATP-binding protein [Georgenia wutianyii]
MPEEAIYRGVHDLDDEDVDGTRRPTSVVLLRDLGDGMLAELVEAALHRIGDVEIHRDVLPAGRVADLVITGSDTVTADASTSLTVAEDGRVLFVLPCAQLTEAMLAMAVSAARARRLQWLDLVLVACRRADALLNAATRTAQAMYDAGGTFADWAARHLGEIDGEPPSDAGTGGSPKAPAAGGFGAASTLLGDLQSLSRGDATSGEPHPLESIIRRYGLSGSDVDVLLLCFVTELDARYGDRFAYLAQDPGATAPTIDLVSTLLATDTVTRLNLYRDLGTGPLARYGLVELGPPAPGRAERSRPLALDRSLRWLLMGSTAPLPGINVLDPEQTARVLDHFGPSSTASSAVAALQRGHNPHLWGSTAAARRSAALDAAALAGRRLLTITTDSLDEAVAERLWREALRLDAIVLVELAGMPTWASVPSGPTPRLLTAASRSLPMADPTTTTGEATATRPNIAVEPPRAAGRLAVWEAAATWTTVNVAGGLGELASRFPVTVDRATATLVAAAGGQRMVTVDVEAVTAALCGTPGDDADGLLVTTHPRATLADLVVGERTRAELEYVCARIRHREQVIVDQGWDQRSSRLTGTYLLFAGPPGTGKSMAAEAIAHELGLPVQYLELSSLLSRWVGDFEKAVDKVFAAAESNGGIVVLDEADAVLARRTEVDSVNARYANSSTSHLLSRLEQFSGNAIFTTNLVGANTIDPAFHRRLTATIRFQLPDEAARARLWRSVWPTVTTEGSPVEHLVDGQRLQECALLDRLAVDHALSGGSIANIARNAAFVTLDRAGGAVADRAAGTGASPVRVDIDGDALAEAVRLELTKIGDFRSLMRPRAGVRNA